MRKIGKFFKWLLIVIVGFVALLYIAAFLGHKVFFKPAYTSKPTIQVVGSGDFKFGVQTLKQPKTSEEYIKILANQVKNYNKRISTYWPNNPETNQYVISQDIKTNKAWLISPDGDIKKLSTDELAKYNVTKTLKQNDEWTAFKGNGVSGAYLTLDPHSMTNYYAFQRYVHIGTYDSFITYSHELFHSITQSRWAKDSYGNAERDERDSDSLGRRYRMQIMQQLAEALSAKTDADRDAKTKAALATYKDYQKNDNEDYKASLSSDRVEGTAYYYEVKTSLYASYPDKIKSDDDVYKAVGVLFANDNLAYRQNGVITESYQIGGYAAYLLDMLAVKNGESTNNWKNQIEKVGNSTPLTMLEDKYAGQTLPAMKTLPTKADHTKWMKEKGKIEPVASRAETIFGIMYTVLYGKS